MILKDNLYTVVSGFTTANPPTACRIALNAEHTIYRAHFPGHPITPGVCIIQMAVELLEELVQSPLTLSEAKNVKYMSVLSPTETPEATYTFDSIDQVEATVRAQVTVSAAQRQIAKISMTCKKRQG